MLNPKLISKRLNSDASKWSFARLNFKVFEIWCTKCSKWWKPWTIRRINQRLIFKAKPIFCIRRFCICNRPNYPPKLKFDFSNFRIIVFVFTIQTNICWLESVQFNFQTSLSFVSNYFRVERKWYWTILSWDFTKTLFGFLKDRKVQKWISRRLISNQWTNNLHFGYYQQFGFCHAIFWHLEKLNFVLEFEGPNWYRKWHWLKLFEWNFKVVF